MARNLTELNLWCGVCKIPLLFDIVEVSTSAAIYVCPHCFRRMWVGRTNEGLLRFKVVEEGEE